MESAHEKASIFQNILIQKLDEFFPEKETKINSDDQPWVTFRLKKLDRQRKRIFRKERRSENWKMVNKLFKKEMKTSKAQFYQKSIANLKLAKPGKWFACLTSTKFVHSCVS